MSSPDPLRPAAPPAKLPVAVIVGPTAVGKTEASIQLARRMDGEIVSADSRLFYRGMDIGTAKPTREEMGDIPHHLIDVADPDETWSLAMFQQAAQQAIAGIHSRGRLPIIVGGTGQYIRAVTHGWSPPAAPPNEALRRALENLSAQYGLYWLHEKLRLLDPAAAASIDPRNVRRTIRALEVIFSTGRRFSDQRSQTDSPYRLLTLGLTRPRPELYARIDARIEKMFADGLLDETRRLLERGYTPDLPAMSAIGYREAAAVLRGEMSLDEAIVQMKRLTRMFVRRQANWFKENDPAITWFRAEPGVVEAMAAWLKQELTKPGIF
ncbi:MAG: tRNA (adenosine(37)-N6)-dimethylallyltransferase MiaA [Anaerolineales bacterium]